MQPLLSLQPIDMVHQQEQLHLLGLLCTACQQKPLVDSAADSCRAEKLLSMICQTPPGAELVALGLLTRLTQPAVLEPILQVGTSPSAHLLEQVVLLHGP